jgi:uncharacterized membrane protein/protein-disulfide isomerase
MMSAFVPFPQAGRGASNVRAATYGAEAAFSAPVRWTLVVLAWLAFGVTSYLAWSAITGAPVFGCPVGSRTGCDAVLSSKWARWMEIPVSVLGLGCYATLAAVGLLLGVRNAFANRWITTFFVMLSIIAAGASLWFLGIQIFVIGAFCPYCLVADICGLVLGILATTFAVRAALEQRQYSQRRTLQPGLIGLRSPTSGGARTAPAVASIESTSPKILPAFGGAVAFIALLVGGQIVFPSSTFGIEKVALDQSIAMDSAKDAKAGNSSDQAATHVAMRVPSDTDQPPSLPNDSAKTDDATKTESANAGAEKGNDAKGESPTSSEPEPPAKERLVKFLGGKLTLDVYKHPILGSPEAPHIVIEMVSYDCPHCRKMHETVQHALERYGDQVAVLIMIQPLDKECNRLVRDPAASHQGACTIARYGIGIAKFNPTAFAAFHEFLMSGDKEKPPAMELILPKAYVLADRGKLRDYTKSDELAKQLDGYINLYDQLQKLNQGKKNFGLPIQIIGDFVMSGSVEKEEDVFKAWEQHLGVKPK